MSWPWISNLAVTNTMQKINMYYTFLSLIIIQYRRAIAHLGGTLKQKGICSL